MLAKGCPSPNHLLRKRCDVVYCRKLHETRFCVGLKLPQGKIPWVVCGWPVGQLERGWNFVCDAKATTYEFFPTVQDRILRPVMVRKRLVSKRVSLTRNNQTRTVS